MALGVEAFLEVLDPGYSPLGVGDHFGEEVGEGGLGELGGSAAGEVAVVDGFTVGGVAEASGVGGGGFFLGRGGWVA